MNRTKQRYKLQSTVISLPTFVCQRCGHTWHPKKEEKPRCCAFCKSSRWGAVGYKAIALMTHHNGRCTSEECMTKKIQVEEWAWAAIHPDGYIVAIDAAYRSLKEFKNDYLSRHSAASKINYRFVKMLITEDISKSTKKPLPQISF